MENNHQKKTIFKGRFWASYNHPFLSHFVLTKTVQIQEKCMFKFFPLCFSSFPHMWVCVCVCKNHAVTTIPPVIKMSYHLQKKRSANNKALVFIQHFFSRARAHLCVHSCARAHSTRCLFRRIVAQPRRMVTTTKEILKKKKSPLCFLFESAAVPCCCSSLPTFGTEKKKCYYAVSRKKVFKSNFV